MIKLQSMLKVFSHFAVQASLLSSTTLLSGQAHASGASKHREYDPPTENRTLAPATRYQGATPIDHSNGLLLNNGTYGIGNTDYESWSKAPVVHPGLSEKKYPYPAKAEFIAGCEESASFVQAAIWNWEETTAETKPEAAEYSKKSIETMNPLLKRAREAISAASSSGKDTWDKTQEAARTAVIEMRATYSGLHRNVRRSTP